jgi:SAM-dependent methyltransferase
MGRGQGVNLPPEPIAATEPDHWFEPIARHLGSAYLRYSFTKGTRQEVDHLQSVFSRVLGAATPLRILDVGCGPGRHAHELARRGQSVHGIDVSERFVELARRTAPPGASFERADARLLATRDDLAGSFDAVVCLCQGGFGLMTANGDDDAVMAGMARSLRPGGVLVLSAFSAYFAVRYHDGAEFDADNGVAHERTEVRDESGNSLEVDLWTGCYTPRELRLLAQRHGLEVITLSSVEPGKYSDDVPTIESPEFLLVARRIAPDGETRACC